MFGVQKKKQGYHRIEEIKRYITLAPLFFLSLTVFELLSKNWKWGALTPQKRGPPNRYGGKLFFGIYWDFGLQHGIGFVLLGVSSIFEQECVGLLGIVRTLVISRNSGGLWAAASLLQHTDSSSIVYIASKQLIKGERWWAMLIWKMTGKLEHWLSGGFKYTHNFYGRLTAFTSIDVRLVFIQLYCKSKIS